MRIYGLGEILGWVVHGWWQRTILMAPLSSYLKRWLLLREPTRAPQFWLDYHSQKTWSWNLTDGKPNWMWTYYYLDSVQHAFRNWVNHGLSTARAAIEDWVWDIRRAIVHTLAWLDGKIKTVAGDLSSAIVAWGNNLASEIYRLSSMLRSWARLRYDAWRVVAGNAWTWITGTGAVLKSWWDSKRSYLDAFLQDPVGWLCTKWNINKTDVYRFFRDPVGWLCTRWGISRSDLFEFLDHPMMWLYDKAEDELVRRW